MEKAIDTKPIHDALGKEKKTLNPSSQVDLDAVELPPNYLNNALDLLKQSFTDCSVNYETPAMLAVGLSGGIDSSTALVAAAEAIGKDNTRAVLLRHDYMTEGEYEDAAAADHLLEQTGIQADTLDISGLVRAHWSMLTEDFGPFVNNLLKAEGLVRARASAMETYSSLNDALTIDTSNFTELVLGNITVGAYIGMVELFEDLLKCEVHVLAKQLGVPERNRIQKKRISEFSMTNNQMFGEEFYFLDPLVHRFVSGSSAEDAAEQLEHPLDWVESIYARMDMTKFRYSAAGPISRMADFTVRKPGSAAWIGGMQSYWQNELLKTKLGKELNDCRARYLP